MSRQSANLAAGSCYTWYMDYIVRHMRVDEYGLLEDFLLGAIFVPEGFEGELSRSIISEDARCRAAFEGFGSRDDDVALVAEVAGEVVGACWVRTTDEYGHIDDDTPSFSISVRERFRGRGIGGALMRGLMGELVRCGYARASLPVQKANPAQRLYERLGFRVVGDGADESEWLMVCHLERPCGLEVVRLGPADVETFIELRVAQLLEEGACETRDLRPALRDHYARHLADGTFVSWLARQDGAIVATSGLSIVEKPPYFGCPTGRIGLVSSMYTTPRLRRGGVARDLVCRIVEEARARGCGVVQISASDAGVPLYESVGFTRNANFRQLTL